MTFRNFDCYSSIMKGWWRSNVAAAAWQVVSWALIFNQKHLFLCYIISGALMGQKPWCTLFMLTDMLFFEKIVAFLYFHTSYLWMHDSVTVWLLIYLQVVARLNEVVTNLLLQGSRRQSNDTQSKICFLRYIHKD